MAKTTFYDQRYIDQEQPIYTEAPDRLNQLKRVLDKYLADHPSSWGVSLIHGEAQWWRDMFRHISDAEWRELGRSGPQEGKTYRRLLAYILSQVEDDLAPSVEAIYQLLVSKWAEDEHRRIKAQADAWVLKETAIADQRVHDAIGGMVDARNAMHRAQEDAERWLRELNVATAENGELHEKLGKLSIKQSHYAKDLAEEVQIRRTLKQRCDQQSDAIKDLEARLAHAERALARYQWATGE